MPKRSDKDEQIVAPGLASPGSAETKAREKKREAEPRTTQALRALEGPHSEDRHFDAPNEFFLPVYGFVRLTDAELLVVNHPAFQRLGGMYQLGQSHLVFRGATHKRFEHCIGTLHVAQEMIDAVDLNHRRARTSPLPAGDSPLGDDLTRAERSFIRLAALLHDIGHLPAGHTLEDELGILDKHDELRRLIAVLDRRDWPGGDSDTLRDIINKVGQQWVSGKDVTAAEVVVQIIAKDPPEEMEEKVEAVVRVGVCRDVVGNTICADLLDYLNRDWYHIGKPQYYDRRLLQYMEVRQDDDGNDQFLVSLGRRPKIRTDAISAILRLLESRYELAETVLFHRTKCSAAAMLERALAEILDTVEEAEQENWQESLTQALLDHGDESILDYLLTEARNRNSEAATLALSRLRQRRLYKGLSTTFWDDLHGDVAKKLVELYSGKGGAGARIQAMHLVEKDFRLPQGSLVMYCPDKHMNKKIAEVKIHVNGVIDTFAKWEQENNKGLGGGHLEAQLHRFQRLWRVHFFLERNAWSDLSESVREHLREAVHTCVLGLTISENTVDASARRIATALSQTKESHFFGRELRQSDLIAARSNQPQFNFPSGAPSLGAFFDD
jgi:HD superfamily phosphohydrolase